MAADPYYKLCARQRRFNDHTCQPNPMTGQPIEWEHAFIHAGQQINERWSIIPICWWAHSGPGLDKNKNQYLALMRATPEDLLKYPKTNWGQLIKFLCSKYEV